MLNCRYTRSEGIVFYHGSAAAHSLLTAIESLQLNMNFETSYVSLAQAVAVKV